LREGRRVTDMRSLRAADTLRLYVPLLEAGDEVTGGPIELRGAATVGGEVLLPGGRVVPLPVQSWPP
jgi:hypothetical protein